MDTAKKALTSQIDLEYIQPLTLGLEEIPYFEIKQTKDGKSKKQLVKVVTKIQNHYAIKREKDLLRYFNQFEETFVHFNEIRKVGFSYLEFFDLVGKQSLASLIKKKGLLSEKQAKKLLKSMLEILHKTHGVGFVHTQIRPENILFSKEGYHLMGWENAIPSISSYETELIDNDGLYCPPERLNGQYDDAGDIYLLGCTLYFALTGKHIFRLNKVKDFSERLYAQAFHTPRKLNRLPVFWRQLIVWMTQKDPKKRPTLEQLHGWLKDQTCPKFIRVDSSKAQHEWPTNPIEDLANSHFMYGLFKQAQAFEAQEEFETAFNLYENCAFQGYSLAEVELGRMYSKGICIRQSYVKAMNMLHHAYQKGNPNAAHLLSEFFAKGYGVQANAKQASKLLEFAALRGHLHAQFSLGELYYDGRGVIQDRIQARFWFGIAANYGLLEAHQRIKQLLASELVAKAG